MHTLPNISRSKGNQKLGRFIEYDVRYFFPENHAENESGRLVPDLFLFFKKALCNVKARGQLRNFNIFW